MRWATMHGWRVVGLALAVAWAVYVMASYLWVDNGGLLTALHQLAALVSGRLLLVGLLLALLGLSLGFAGGKRFRGTSAFVTLGAFLFGLVVWKGWPGLRGSVGVIENQPDKFRVSLLVMAAVACGIAYWGGGRLAGSPPTMGLSVSILILPSLVVVLLNGGVGKVLVVPWVILVAEALGQVVLVRLVRVGAPSGGLSVRSATVDIAVGLALLSVGVLGLGLVGLVGAKSLVGFLIVLTLLLSNRVLARLKKAAGLPWDQPAHVSAWEWAALFMAATILAVYLVAALAPEIGPDALGGRVAMPARFMRDGAIRPLPEILWSYGFIGGEMLYLLVMPLAGYNAAKLLQLGVAVVLLGGTAREVGRRTPARDSWMWLLPFFGSSLVWCQMALGFVDLLQTFFYFACVLAVIIWLDEPDRPAWLAAAGVAGGAATAVKVNGAAALAIGAVVLLIATRRRTRSIATSMKHLTYFLLPALVVLLPWMVRAACLTGNPVFPWANGFFKSPLCGPLPPLARFGLGLTFPAALRVPWGVVFDPGRYVETGSYSPFLLAMVGLAFVGYAGARRRDLAWLLTFGLGALLWLVTEQNSRYSLGAALLASVAIAIGLGRLEGHLGNTHWRPLLRAFCLTVLVVGFVLEITRPTCWFANGYSGLGFPTGVVLHPGMEEEYLEKSVSTYPAAIFLNRNYGSRAKLFEVNTNDHLYFTCETVSWPHGVLPLMHSLGATFSGELDARPDEIYRRLHEHGFTHLLVTTSWQHLAEKPEEERSGIFGRPFEDAYLIPEFADRGVFLYRIREHPGQGRQATTVNDNLLVGDEFRSTGLGNERVAWHADPHSQTAGAENGIWLSLQKGTQAWQRVGVYEGVLYELTLDVRTAGKSPAGFAQINWTTATGELRLLWRQSLTSPGRFRRFRFLQTAPPGSRYAVVYLGGGPIDVRSVTLQEVRP